jgi:hypothetical protein
MGLHVKLVVLFSLSDLHVFMNAFRIFVKQEEALTLNVLLVQSDGKHTTSRTSS